MVPSGILLGQRSDATVSVGAMNIYQPVLRHSNFFSNTPDTHFARDTHMRIILGNSGNVGHNKTEKKGERVQDNSNTG